MTVQRITQWADLHPYRAQWDELAGDCVFRSWAWLTTWWQHYGADQQLFVLLVFADDDSRHCQPVAPCSDTTSSDTTSYGKKNLVAILPCYLASNFPRGRVLRLVGDGEVCSDYLDMLVDSGAAGLAAAAVARFLCENASEWDTTEFTAVGADSVGLSRLCNELQSVGCRVDRTPKQNRWSVALPDDWESFLALQSKSHRKQLRRLERRVLNTEQAIWHLVQTDSEFDIAWPHLVDLHQRRRISLDEPGCFASQPWAAFHRDIAQQLLHLGKLRLSWLEIAGEPIAAEYHFAGEDVTWAYQGGVDPNRIDEEPGRLSMICSMQHAIDEGHRHFDLLRGDEPYKAHWRATPQPIFDIQIVPARSAARWRSQACSYLQRTARLARQLTSMRFG